MIEITDKTQWLEAIEGIQTYIDERNIYGYGPILDMLWDLINEDILSEGEEEL